jgi:very-long-chain (3R)-3-hydroxyacyl-CoA dehydratase
LVPFFQRATTAYGRVGEVTAWVQSLALLEVVHAFTGIVRSPLKTTAMQVTSRLLIIWAIVENYEVVSPATLAL